MKPNSDETRKTRRIKEDKDEKMLEDSIFDDAAFRWRCFGLGHRWMTVRATDAKNITPQTQCKWTRVITDGVSLGQMWEGKHYSPLLKQGLFIEFAHLDTSEDSILEFVNEWGLLGVRGVLVRPEDVGGAMLSGEDYQIWRDSIRQTNEALTIWEACRAENRQTLRKFLRWQDGDNNRFSGWVFHVDYPERSPRFPNFIPSRGIFLDQADYPDLASTDYVGAGNRLLQQMINEVLKENASPRVLWHKDRREFVIRILPRTLFGAIWWQFARAFTGEIRYRSCKVCGKPIEISEVGFRSDREFCSPACRQKDHRTKVAEAKKLHADGIKVRAIAKQMNTTAETIKHWLQKKK